MVHIQAKKLEFSLVDVALQILCSLLVILCVFLVVPHLLQDLLIEPSMTAAVHFILPYAGKGVDLVLLLALE